MKSEVSLFWLCIIRHSFHIDIADSVLSYISLGTIREGTGWFTAQTARQTSQPCWGWAVPQTAAPLREGAESHQIASSTQLQGEVLTC